MLPESERKNKGFTHMIQTAAEQLKAAKTTDEYKRLYTSIIGVAKVGLNNIEKGGQA